MLLRATRQLTGLGSIPLHVEAERGGHGGKQWMDGKKGADKVGPAANLFLHTRAECLCLALCRTVPNHQLCQISLTSATLALTVLGQVVSATCLSASC